MAVLHLPNEFRESLTRWSEVAYPYEGCGLLIGEQGNGQSVVKRVTRAKNMSLKLAGERYSLDPLHFLAADSAARAENMSVLGVWHSHPDKSALPSDTDLAAAWPEWSYVIVAVNRHGVAEIRSWRLNEIHWFIEEEIQS
jgi:proteasome lid subunit RPN8/RPN11